jgi:Fe-S cluster assembly iron-binding protein IscA
LGLALDEPKEDDEYYETGELSFILGPSVMRAAKAYGSILIDYVDNIFGKGFRISFTAAAAC